MGFAGSGIRPTRMVRAVIADWPATPRRLKLRLPLVAAIAPHL